MCGIIFSYLSADELTLQKSRVLRALAQMRHRGPDEGNSIVLSSAIVGHRRLSIMDIHSSHQPMTEASQRYYLTFNGEVYNFRKLKRALQARWQFTTQGDTEVVLAGLVLEGEAFISKMEGMWALAFWDEHSKQLLLSRDRMGKKPLYYYHRPNAPDVLHCASELPALLTLLKKPPQESDNSRADFFKYGYILPGHTIYQHVSEVKPGHNVVWQQQKLHSHGYWSFSPQTESSHVAKADIADQLKTELHDAVNKRLIADVEVGAFLSGGVDSSLVVALASAQNVNQLKTFTIGFEDPAYDESHYAQQVAQQFKSQHHLETLAGFESDVLATLLATNIGQPFGDASILPTHLVSSLAAEKVKVVLSGDGGDELFSGYERYTARTILQWYSRLPSLIRKSLETVIKALPVPAQHHSVSLLKKAHQFFEVNQRQREEWPYVAPLLFRQKQFEQYLPGEWTLGNNPPERLEETRLEDISRMMYADALVYLPQDVLTKVDRASMASSLEVRAPFLDHKVVELAFSIPLQSHRKGSVGKQMLKQAFTDLLPRNIWQRRKQGFAVPLSHWFKADLGDLLEDRLYQQQTPLHHQNALKLLKQHRRGEGEHGMRLWMFYSYLLYRELFQ